MHSPTDRAAEHDAEHAAERSEEGGLHQKLEENLGTPRAERLAHADLARPLGHRNGHDRHHADAADHEGDRRDDDEREKRGLADSIPQLEERVLGYQIEVVWLIELEAVANPHDALDVGHRGRLADAVARHDGNLNRQKAHVACDAYHLEAEQTLVGRIRDHDEVVLSQIEPAGRRPFIEHAHHLEPLAADSHRLADRVDSRWREQQLVRGIAEDDDVLPVLHFGTVEEAAAEDGDARPCREILRRAEQDNRLGLHIAVEHAPLRRRAAGAELDVDELNRPRLLLECTRVGNTEVRALQQVFDLRAVGKAGDAEALDEDRVRPDRAKHLAERLIEAANERRHPDNRGDADDDTENRQPGAHFVAPHRVERHRHDLGQQAPADSHHAIAFITKARSVTKTTKSSCTKLFFVILRGSS